MFLNLVILVSTMILVCLGWRFHDTIPGDTIDDWLTEGGQTVDMRSLWTSHVRLLVDIGAAVLTEVVDRDDRAAVCQGIVEENLDRFMGAHSTAPHRPCSRRIPKNTRRARSCGPLSSLFSVLEYSIPMVCLLFPSLRTAGLTLRRRTMEVSGNEIAPPLIFSRPIQDPQIHDPALL